MITQTNIEQMLRDNGFSITGIKGRSMLPMLRQEEDRALIASPVFPLKPYTVALYKRGEQYILHRVIRPEPGGYLIRGDNTTYDEHIKESEIIGVLSGFWRGEQYFECTDEFNLENAKRSIRTRPWRKVRRAFALVKHRLSVIKQKLL